MYGSEMFGEDGTFAAGYGESPAGAPQVPGTVIGVEAVMPGVQQVPGTVVGVEAALPAGVKAQPGTVIGMEAAMPAGVKAQPGTVVVAGATAARPVQEFAQVRPLSTVGRGGRSIDGGLPPLPRATGLDSTLWMSGLGTNMPLPGRPVGAQPYPYDMQRFRGETVGSYFGPMKPGINYWSGADIPYKDYKSANYATDGYVYRLYADPAQSIDVFKSGKLTAAKITATSSPAAYNAIRAEIAGQKRVDPALLVAAINAATIIGAAAITATGPATTASGSKPKRSKKFEVSAASAPPPEPVASPGLPVWVWVAGGGVVVLGLGLMLFGGHKAEPDTGKKGA